MRHSSTIMQIFTPISARCLSPDRKNTYFFLHGTPLLSTVPCFTFVESSRQANVTPHLTCNAATKPTVFEIFAVKIWDFWPIRGTPKREKTCPESISTIMQNFTPIGAIVAEISVTGHKNTNIERTSASARRISRHTPSLSPGVLSTGR